jgi:hypothetical protein
MAWQRWVVTGGRTAERLTWGGEEVGEIVIEGEEVPIVKLTVELHMLHAYTYQLIEA